MSAATRRVEARLHPADDRQLPAGQPDLCGDRGAGGDHLDRRTQVPEPRQFRQHHPVIRDADLRRPRDDLRDHGGVHRPLHRGHHLARGRGDRHDDRSGRTGPRHPHRPLGRPDLRVDQQHPDHLERGPDPGRVAVHHLRHEPGLWRGGADVRPGRHAVPDVFGDRHLDLRRDQLGHDRVPVRVHRDGRSSAS